ncbi:unnamed protein product [Nesidiocoris tenuis]|uniref:Uncharacterized protein n=1 Tax=Nesidiocoris tenuis TaxID=355587 RepID=A0A6H5HKY2_9HEMI|nr:unnamed protein product [Nesidiocoris tenuis]
MGFVLIGMASCWRKRHVLRGTSGGSGSRGNRGEDLSIVRNTLSVEFHTFLSAV